MDVLPVVLAIATPLLAFAGALLGQVLARRGALEQDVRWRREETMRLLRWAAELASGTDYRRKLVGVATLRGLQRSELLQPDDQALMSAVLDVVALRVSGSYPRGDEQEGG